MKARGPLLLLVCALGTLLVLPAGAVAKPGYVIKPKGLYLSIPLDASHGYSALLSSGDRREVALEISKGGFSATYKTLGRISSKRIEADLGDFGHISLRFKPKSRFTPEGPLAGSPLPPRMRERCVGKKAVGERGIFEGSVSFRGERDYTEVAARRVKGTILRTYRRVCNRPVDLLPELKQEGVFYLAQAKRAGVLRFLFGIDLSVSIGKEKFAATVAAGGERKKVGPVLLRKQLLVIEEGSSIDAGPAGRSPETAEVELQKPFEGSASYLQEGDAPATWTGDLSARLPGSGLVPLTGPEFEAELCRATGEAGIDRCIESLDSPLVQDSSHSLALALR
jgi:hypothetical protein